LPVPGEWASHYSRCRSVAGARVSGRCARWSARGRARGARLAYRAGWDGAHLSFARRQLGDDPGALDWSAAAGSGGAAAGRGRLAVGAAAFARPRWVAAVASSVVAASLRGNSRRR